MPILVVYDDDLVRETIVLSLAQAGYQTVTASNGDDALAVLSGESVDLVILDVLMPQREGIETLRVIRQRWAKLPVLMISGGDRTGWTDALNMTEKLGASETLPKPFSPAQLLERVRSLLGAA